VTASASDGSCARTTTSTDGCWAAVRECSR
jgi:hypothetical protein